MRHEDGTFDNVEAHNRSSDAADAGGQAEDDIVSGRPVSDPKATVGHDRKHDPTAQPAEVETSDADRTAGGRSPTPDDTHAAVDTAERAVLELKGRRMLEQQYAQAQARDDQSTAGQAMITAAVDGIRRAELGPALSAFDD